MILYCIIQKYFLGGQGQNEKWDIGIIFERLDTSLFLGHISGKYHGQEPPLNWPLKSNILTRGWPQQKHLKAWWKNFLKIIKLTPCFQPKCTQNKLEGYNLLLFLLYRLHTKHQSRLVEQNEHLISYLLKIISERRE